MSYQPGMNIPSAYPVGVSTLFMHSRHNSITYGGDGYARSVGQDELDLVQSLAPSPVLDSGCPSVASVAQSVYEDDGSRVLGRGREQQGWGSSHSHSGIVVVTITV